MIVIKVINLFNIVAGIFVALLNAKLAADFFSEQNVRCVILHLAFAAGCLLGAWLSKNMFDFVNSTEEEKEDEIED